MCSECRKQFCPSSCPDAERPADGCVDCGGSADFRSADGKLFCRDCVSEMPLDELFRFCGVRDVFDLLSRLERPTAPELSGKKQ